jgi:hypothetical protein
MWQEPISCGLVWGVRVLARRRWGLLLRGWCWPIRRRGVSFFHRHPGILHTHLRAFAASFAHNILPVRRKVAECRATHVVYEPGDGSRSEV